MFIAITKISFNYTNGYVSVIVCYTIYINYNFNKTIIYN